MKPVLTAVASALLAFSATAALAAFGNIDTDADGAVSAEEFTAAYPDLAAEVFTAVDVNADGVITEEEHLAAVEAGVLPAE